MARRRVVEGNTDWLDKWMRQTSCVPPKEVDVLLLACKSMQSVGTTQTYQHSRPLQPAQGAWLVIVCTVHAYSERVTPPLFLTWGLADHIHDVHAYALSVSSLLCSSLDAWLVICMVQPSACDPSSAPHLYSTSPSSMKSSIALLIIGSLLWSFKYILCRYHDKQRDPPRFLLHTWHQDFGSHAHSYAAVPTSYTLYRNAVWHKQSSVSK